MDPEANLQEQKARAMSFMDTWDACPEDGEFTQTQLNNMAHDGYRLAELVLALAEWKKKDGYSPV